VKLWKTATVALISAIPLLACLKGQDQDSSSNAAQAISRKTLDGAYMKIYGGKQSYFVFHTATGSEKKNTFFAEFESDGELIRAEGIFTYGHDNLGNYIDLRRNDGTQSDYSSSSSSSSSSGGGGEPQDAGEGTDDAGSSAGGDDAGDPSADAGSSTPNPSDPTAPVYQRTHFVKTGVHQTILIRDGRDRTYQFKMVSSYCGEGGTKDCNLQKGASECATKWKCSAKHTCECDGS
jgi:hypothetical protein